MSNGIPILNSASAAVAGLWGVVTKQDGAVTTTIPTFHEYQPASLEGFAGITVARERLTTAIAVAKKQRWPAIDTVLLTGPPGSGKSTLATAIGYELGVERTAEYIGKHFAKWTTEDIAVWLATMVPNREPSLVLIDECHGFPPALWESLYNPLRSNRIKIGSQEIPLPPTTFVLATTNPEKLPEPLRDRCRLTIHLGDYSIEEASAIATYNADANGYSLGPQAATLLALGGRLTPRLITNCLRDVLDAVTLDGAEGGTIEVGQIMTALRKIGIDVQGLDTTDRQYLAALQENWTGRKTMGLATLASKLRESEKTLVAVREPFLLRLGMMTIEHGGRRITPTGLAHLQRARTAGYPC